MSSAKIVSLLLTGLTLSLYRSSTDFGLVSTLIRMPKNSGFHPELSIAARLGMNAYPYPSDLVRKLTPAFTELIERGYLVSTDVIKLGKFTRIKFLRMGAQSTL
jgi:hypothetical protein